MHFVNLKVVKNILLNIMKDFNITKRDGSQDRFSLDKIMNAVIKAFQSVDEDVD